MFKKITLAACAAALLFGAIPAHANMRLPYQNKNGTAMNGLFANGLSLKGVRLNGVKMNSLMPNGLFANGTEIAAAARLRVVGVELPPAAR